jgi:glucan phosphoethanolaminetransferase (alkaline phosphatase superfamily)
MQEFEVSKWELLREFFIERLKNPLAHPEFFGYLFVVVIGFGGFGVWFEIYDQNQENTFNHIELSKALIGFSVAIVTAGCIELMFVKSAKIKNSLFFLSFIMIIVMVVSYFIVREFNSCKVYWLSIPISLVAIFTWWIGNGRNSNLTDDFFDDQSEETKRLTNIIENRHKSG